MSDQTLNIYVLLFKFVQQLPLVQITLSYRRQ